MPRSLPPEIIDLILEYLCNEPITLKACCLASKSWIPRTRKYLFARIYFGVYGPTIRSWMKAFPDPADSPAHHARHLWMSETNAINAPCIRSFHHVEALRVSAVYQGKSGEAPLIRLHGLSPTLKCLHLSHFSVPLSDLFNLVCSFPLLKDLTLHCEGPASVSDGWIPPLTSPRFTGTLRLIEEIRLPARGLLVLSGGLRFTNIVIVCPVEYAGSAMDLVSECSDALESLCIGYRPSESPGMLPPLDLSHVAKLKDLEFRFETPNVRWIVTTLQTAKTKCLRQITIFSAVAFAAFDEVVLREWQDFDHVLVRLWTSHSIIPKIKSVVRTGEGMYVREAAPIMLPELVNRGVACETGDYRQFLRGS